MSSEQFQCHLKGPSNKVRTEVASSSKDRQTVQIVPGRVAYMFLVHVAAIRGLALIVTWRVKLLTILFGMDIMLLLNLGNDVLVLFRCYSRK